MTGCDNQLGTRGQNLIPLDFQADIALLAVPTDTVEAAAAAAAEIVLTIGRHFAEIFCNIAHDFPGDFLEAMIPDVIAGVLEGHRFLEEHGGQIVVGDAPEGGAQFDIQLPLPEDHAQELEERV